MKWNDLMQALGGLLLDFLYFGKSNKIYMLLRDDEMLVENPTLTTARIPHANVRKREDENPRG